MTFSSSSLEFSIYLPSIKRTVPSSPTHFVYFNFYRITFARRHNEIFFTTLFFVSFQYFPSILLLSLSYFIVLFSKNIPVFRFFSLYLKLCYFLSELPDFISYKRILRYFYPFLPTLFELLLSH